MLPQDKQGFYHRRGIKSLKQLQLSNEDEKIQRVLATLCFVEKLLNTIHIMRKTTMTWEEAEGYWEKWRKTMPWEGNSFAIDETKSLLSLSDLKKNFLHKLPKLHLFERDQAFQVLGEQLTFIFNVREEVYFQEDDIGHLFTHYVVYGIGDLLSVWDKTSLQYVAPFYPTQVVEEESFGVLSQVFYTNFFFPHQVEEVFQEGEKGKIRGYYDLEGNFHEEPDYILPLDFE